jgi:hypothetical protein
MASIWIPIVQATPSRVLHGRQPESGGGGGAPPGTRRPRAGPGRSVSLLVTAGIHAQRDSRRVSPKIRPTSRSLFWACCSPKASPEMQLQACCGCGFRPGPCSSAMSPAVPVRGALQFQVPGAGWRPWPPPDPPFRLTCWAREGHVFYWAAGTRSPKCIQHRFQLPLTTGGSSLSRSRSPPPPQCKPPAVLRCSGNSLLHLLG